MSAKKVLADTLDDPCEIFQEDFVCHFPVSFDTEGHKGCLEEHPFSFSSSGVTTCRTLCKRTMEN